MRKQRQKSNTSPVLNSEFVPVPTRRKAGPGRTPAKYRYEVRGIVHEHTAVEWQTLLGLSGRNTFYNRIKWWQRDPVGHPPSWVFRCAPDAPFASKAHQEPRIEPMTPADAATLTALVQSELGDIMGEFE